jgi:exodeoxyribonuclease VII small subunit
MAKKKKQAGGSGEASGEAPTFEQALARLEKIVQRLEGGQLTLSESLAQYEHGVKCLQYCYRQLERAERKIELLSGVDAEGRVKSQPFDESEMSLEEKQAARSRRRSGNAAPSESEARDAEIDDGRSLF